MCPSQPVDTHENSACPDCPAARSGPCQWLESDLRDSMAAVSSYRSFSQGEAILPGGQVPAWVGTVLSGLVKITTIDEQGNEHVLQLLHPGAMIGDPFGSAAPFSYDAATDTRLCLTPRNAMKEAFDRNPDAYAAHLRIAMRQQLEQHFAQLALRGRNSLQRVAYWISTQTPDSGSDRVLSVRILLSRRDLASLLEMTVETLSRNLHQLADRGLIRIVTPHRLEITDAARLRLLARDQDARLKNTLLRHGWEWGARAVNLPRYIPRLAGRTGPPIGT
ncbi:MAG: Crp/Fnr family transcriptional regulator [Rhodobacteraceae bacterium]|jgi:CRP/FNR family transcriptional regulator|nr:Crp/Fnr family transcriptional regulator [Paracoccaceae bacterium]